MFIRNRRNFLATVSLIQFRDSPCLISAGQSVTGAGFSSAVSSMSVTVSEVATGSTSRHVIFPMLVLHSQLDISLDAESACPLESFLWCPKAQE
jgi:hypothetical protein